MIINNYFSFHTSARVCNVYGLEHGRECMLPLTTALLSLLVNYKQSQSKVEPSFQDLPVYHLRHQMEETNTLSCSWIAMAFRHVTTNGFRGWACLNAASQLTFSVDEVHCQVQTIPTRLSLLKKYQTHLSSNIELP